jgi:hypothetical protein
MFCLYPDAMLNGLIERHLRIESGRGKQVMRERLRGGCGWLWLGLHHRRRPTGGSLRASLGKPLGPLKKARRLLLALDADSRWLLEEQAAKDERFSELFPSMDWAPQALVAPPDWPKAKAEAILDGIVPDGMGDTRYELALEAIAAFVDWIEKALAPIEDSKPGRRGTYEQRAVDSLRDIMRDALGADPSPEQLQAFVDDLFAPLREGLRENGILLGPMTGHVHQALYGGRN